MCDLQFLPREKTVVELYEEVSKAAMSQQF
jgi:hypothetical protein